MAIRTPQPKLSPRQRAELARQKISPARFLRTQQTTSQTQVAPTQAQIKAKESKEFVDDKIDDGYVREGNTLVKEVTKTFIDRRGISHGSEEKVAVREVINLDNEGNPVSYKLQRITGGGLRTFESIDYSKGTKTTEKWDATGRERSRITTTDVETGAFISSKNTKKEKRQQAKIEKSKLDLITPPTHDPLTGAKLTKTELAKFSEQLKAGVRRDKISVVPFDEQILTTPSASRYFDDPKVEKADSFLTQFGKELLTPTQFVDERQSADYFGADKKIEAIGFIDPFAKQSLRKEVALERAGSISYGTAGFELKRNKEEIQRQKDEFDSSLIGKATLVKEKVSNFYDEKVKGTKTEELIKDLPIVSAVDKYLTYVRPQVKQFLGGGVKGFEDTAAFLSQDKFAQDKETSQFLRESGWQGTSVPNFVNLKGASTDLSVSEKWSLRLTPEIHTQASTLALVSSFLGGVLKPYAKTPELVAVDYFGGKLLGTGAGYLTTIGGKSGAIRQGLLLTAGVGGGVLLGAKVTSDLKEIDSGLGKAEFLGGEFSRGAVSFAGFHSGFKFATTPKISNIEVTGFKEIKFAQTGGTPKGSKGIPTKEVLSLGKKVQPDLIFQHSTKFPFRNPTFTRLHVTPSGGFERLETQLRGGKVFQKLITQESPKFSTFGTRETDITILKPTTKVKFAGTNEKNVLVALKHTYKPMKLVSVQDFVTKGKLPQAKLTFFKEGKVVGTKLIKPQTLKTTELISVDTILKSKEFKTTRFGNEDVSGIFQKGKNIAVQEIRGENFIGKIGQGTKVQQLDTIKSGRFRTTTKNIKLNPKAGEKFLTGKVTEVGFEQINIRPGKQRLVQPRFKTTTQTEILTEATTGQPKGFVIQEQVLQIPELQTLGNVQVIYKGTIIPVPKGQAASQSFIFDKFQAPKPRGKSTIDFKNFKIPDSPKLNPVRAFLIKSKGKFGTFDTSKFNKPGLPGQTITQKVNIPSVTTTRAGSIFDTTTTLKVPTLRALVPTISKTALLSFTATRLSTLAKTETKIDTKIDTILDTRVKTETKLDTKIDTIIDTKTILDTKTLLDTETIIDTTTKTKTKTEIDIKIPPPPEIPPPPSILFPLPFFKGSRVAVNRKEGSFNTFVKSKGKWLRANKQPRTRMGALSLGAKAVDNSSSASFRISPSKKVASKNLINDNYFNFNGHKFNKKNGIYIEKRNKRIDTLGEIQGITAKGWLANKNRGNKWL